MSTRWPGGKLAWMSDFAKVATIISLGGKTTSGLNRQPFFMWGDKVGETIAQKIKKGYEDEEEKQPKPLLSLYRRITARS